MSWANAVRSMYLAFHGPGGAVSAHTYDTLPDNDDTTLTAHGTADTIGAYGELAATVGAADVWLCGLLVSNPGSALGLTTLDAKVILATGAAASETARITVPYQHSTHLTTTPGLGAAFYTVPFPIHVPNGTRLAGNFKSGNAVADTLDVVSFHATGLR